MLIRGEPFQYNHGRLPRNRGAFVQVEGVWIDGWRTIATSMKSVLDAATDKRRPMVCLGELDNIHIAAAPKASVSKEQ